MYIQLVSEDDVSMKGEYCDVNVVADSEMNAFDLKRTNQFQRLTWTSAPPGRKGNIYFSYVLCAEFT
jgi:hypothetical protein